MEAMIASFLKVFLRAFQQQNVTGGHYFLASITPFFIAVAEVAVVIAIVNIGWSSVLWIGAGGAIGVTSAMLLHRKMIAR